MNIRYQANPRPADENPAIRRHQMHLVGPGALTSCTRSRGRRNRGRSEAAGMRVLGTGTRAPPEVVLGGIDWTCYLGSLNAFLVRSRPHAGLDPLRCVVSIPRCGVMIVTASITSAAYDDAGPFPAANAPVRTGVERGQIDLSAELIRGFERLGSISGVRWPASARLQQRRRPRATAAAHVLAGGRVRTAIEERPAGLALVSQRSPNAG
jgi:hypothetical protein